MQHRFIVKLQDIFIDTQENNSNFTIIYLVLELCKTDLHQLTQTEKFYLDEKQIKVICYNIAIAVNYLHSCGVLHRDLKPGNILINEKCTIKITDFGLARSVGEPMQPIPAEESQAIAKKQIKKITFTQQSKLTQHVVTRWYRAPELILIEKKYTDKIDIWSLGCIFGEVFGMLKDNFPEISKRNPLFPGSSCFPLSPQANQQNQKKVLQKSRTDQLSIIINRLGKPDENDMSFINDQNAKNYLASFEGKSKKEAQKIFYDYYPYSSKEAIDLLKKMLQFNPKNRPSIAEVLQHDYFNSVSDKAKEVIQNAELISMDFDDEKEYEIDPLRKMFIKEMEIFNSKLK
eukprot:TRINITY_DN644_c0_g1_i3.p1 TRINITY_DN644_c0_g1~~TRINITY_DN644_c0_g1_i3.p1  ORF type:complete len:345 (-),score=68.06 TRINITY_DN644_c0_g1_i3:152-1186(-)